MPVTVALVDDTRHVREMLASMLALDGFNVVGQGERGDEAAKLASELHPDVMVIDYAMPGMNGLAAAKEVRSLVPDQSIILYTAYLDDALREAAREAGVATCIGKVEGIAALERSISELCLQLGRQ